MLSNRAHGGVEQVIYNLWADHHPYPDKECQQSGRQSPFAVGRRYVEGREREVYGSFSHFSHTYGRSGYVLRILEVESQEWI